MRRFIILLLIVMPLVATAQKLQVYTDAADNNQKYLAIYAYGLPREVVKTNQQIREMKYGDTGIVRRHHTTKYEDGLIGDDGYTSDSNPNLTLSFAFLIAPYNVDTYGNEITYEGGVSWYDASGWDPMMDSVEDGVNVYGLPKLRNTLSTTSKANATPTGCAAYCGPNKDESQRGKWRLPTQREALMMFTIMEQALQLEGADEVTNSIKQGNYWTSTELMTSSYWKAWYLDSKTGAIVNIEKIDAHGAFSLANARCVRDIDNDPIND